MNWKSIWSAISGLVSGLQETSKWKMSVNGVAHPPPTEVEASEAGIRFVFEEQGKKVTFEATPGSLTHATVSMNGKVEAGTQLVFSLKHQPLKPLIVVFEFKKVMVGGKVSRYRFDNPK